MKAHLNPLSANIPMSVYSVSTKKVLHRIRINAEKLANYSTNIIFMYSNAIFHCKFFGNSENIFLIDQTDVLPFTHNIQSHFHFPLYTNSLMPVGL